MASENDTATPEAAEPTTSAPAASPADSDDKSTAPKKATRKRASKKADPAPEPDAADGSEKPDDPATADQPAKAKRSGRRSKAAEVDGSAAQDSAAADPAPEGSVDSTGEATGAGTSFGLLFQAPEPTVAPRRRRASAPAQAPAERPADVAPAEAPETASSDADDTGDGGEAGDGDGGSRRRRRGGRGRRGRGKGDDDQTGSSGDDASADAGDGKGKTDATGRGDGESGTSEGSTDDSGDDGESSSSRRRRRRRRGSSGADGDDPPGTVTKVRQPRSGRDEPTAVKGSTRLEAKKQRRREGREAGRRRTVITEAEFLARRESVERSMVVRDRDGRTQIGVLEDGVLVEHYVSRETTASMAGNVYLGRVQNVLPSMEAAFVDIGKGRNAVLYAGEVNWDAAGLEGGQAKRIENALSSGDTVLVQVTKDPIGHKGARLTSQISLPGRYVVYVPEGSMTGISRKLPDTERARLKAILKEVVPDGAGVIVRTAAEGASEDELKADVERLTKQWDRIRSKADKASSKKSGSGGAPALLHGEPDLTIRVIRDVFTEDFASLVVSGDKAWGEVSEYVEDVAPDLAQRLTRWTDEQDVFAAHRIDEQIAKAMDRKVWLPSGGSLVIDRTEAMTVVDVNTGKFVGSGGNLEETVTKNNLEAAEEIVRQLRLRDIGGIIVIDFIDMVLESNRDLVVRRLLECLGRDRTKHQVAEVTSLGLVQMTRKRVGSGLIEVFSEPCEHCSGRGIVVHAEPVERSSGSGDGGSGRSRGRRGGRAGGQEDGASSAASDDKQQNGPTAAQIAAAAHAAALKHTDHDVAADDVAVELEDGADVSAPAPPEDDTPPAPDAPAPTQDAAADETTRAATEEASVEEAPARPRRRRGRVVAPAGPPTAAEPSPADEAGPETSDQVG
ncbi:Rne/Rng family ribonuclease [Phycicoccus sp. CSK15P-2]|uniref:Rne/Rng family ribonuclease n=1 Tax=Phycicoccus sp. CSK15P-2 TaxID=2807627 RepID=UPI00194FECDB|nr:Rne/Rng family ribonuclease [Phycicoccus sp. CSK15P-2]MBM6404676.1 Rne/Rng family ribonuclease [Phycicoccus sp. CSK15P-2]